MIHGVVQPLHHIGGFLLCLQVLRQFVERLLFIVDQGFQLVLEVREPGAQLARCCPSLLVHWSNVHG
jgi:hypothetical protein